MKKSKGLFITFEGVEGCGKSTQAKLLQTWLKGRGHQVVLTREPGGPSISEKIRRILLDNRNKGMSDLTELMLLEASRAQHLAQVIVPALKAGQIVICDRFADSSTAYQGYGRGMDIDMVNNLNKIAVDGYWPDLTLVIDLPIEIGFVRARARKRGLDRMETQTKNFHRKVSRGFKAIAQSDPQRIKILDGKFPPDVIHGAVRQMVLNIIKRKK
jgi:dTMP kinase